MKRISLFLVSFISLSAYAQTKILFDATKAETAGNADWVIDADQHNLDWNPGPILNGGNESNAQSIPSPNQNSINSANSETTWNGALSNWGIDLVKLGYQVETLPYNQQITYGNTSNAKDLSNYSVFVVCEPNILFTATEKIALLHFVQNGGGLFMISDHDQSDRNGDGEDSPHIWDNFMLSNSIQSNPFGITFDYQNISQTSTNIANYPSDSILHGLGGNVAEIMFSNGTTITLDTTANASAQGLIYENGSTAGGLTNCMFARSNYFLGKVAALGDSSPCDDGTGDNNDVLYNGYTADAAGNHKKLLINTIVWLSHSNQLNTIQETELKNQISVYPNPSSENFTLYYASTKAETKKVQIFNSLGELVWERVFSAKEIVSPITLSLEKKGIYLVRMNQQSVKILKQ